MIWNSVVLMTVIDVTIIWACGHAIWALHKHNNALRERRTQFGFRIVIAGLGIMGAFYIADLATMHVLPLVMPAAEAMTAIKILHLEFGWLSALFALVAISLGFWSSVIAVSDITARLFSARDDITALRRVEKELHEQTEELHHRAYHDGMTGLPNRINLLERLRQDLGDPAGQGQLALHLVDTDGLKDINDSLGHDAGDRLIEITAERLRAVTSPDDFVARLGGDEFAVLQKHATSHDVARDFARHMASALAEPFLLGRHEIRATVSIGIALASTDGSDVAELSKNADLALYRAKAEGRNRTRFFTRGMGRELEGRVRLERNIRDALLNDGFELLYQPVVEAKDYRLAGFESLLRMRLQNGHLASPSTFIPVAEEMGLINEIGAWVIQQACRAAATWPDHLKVSVNLSAHQLTEVGIRDIVADALAATSLEPHRLELEITESSLLHGTEAVIAELRKLKGLGVGIVMDDFGKGHSCLSYLWQFPFDRIKIDGAFMRAFESENDDQAETIVKTIVRLGQTLDMRVTAEGVENDRQSLFAAGAGCDQIQGFFFDTPMPDADVAACILHDFGRLIEDRPSETGALRNA